MGDLATALHVRRRRRRGGGDGVVRCRSWCQCAGGGKMLDDGGPRSQDLVARVEAAQEKVAIVREPIAQRACLTEQRACVPKLLRDPRVGGIDLPRAESEDHDRSSCSSSTARSSLRTSRAPSGTITTASTRNEPSPSAKIQVHSET